MKNQLLRSFALLLVITSLITACRQPKDFYPAVSPEFVLPIAKGKIVLKDYIKSALKDTNIKEDPATKLYRLKIQQDIEKIAFDTIVKINDVVGDKSTFKFPEFNVPDQKPAPIVFKLATFNLGLPNGNFPVAAFPTTPPQSQAISLGDSIDFIILKTGTVDLIVTNNFKFPIDATLALANDTGVHTESLGSDTKTIQPGSSKTITLDLATKTLYSKLKLSLSFSSPGTGGNPVAIDNANDEITAQLSLTNLKADKGKAKINTESNNINRNDTIRIGGLGNGAILKSVLFKGGIIDFSITGDASILNLAITSGDIKKSAGANFVVTEAGLVNDPMDGYKFNFSTRPNDSNFVVVNTTASVKKDAQGFVTFDTNNIIEFKPSITGPKFKKVQGFFGVREVNTTQTVNGLDSNMAFLKNITPNSIKFNDVSAEIALNSTLGIPFGIDLYLNARSNFGETYNVVDTVINTIDPCGENANDGGPIMTPVSVKIPSDKLAKLLNSIPKTLTAQNKLVVNKGADLTNPPLTNFIYDTSSVSGKMIISAPFSLFFNNLTYADTNKLALEVQRIEEVRDVRGFLQMNIKNGFNLSILISAVTLDTLTGKVIDTLVAPVAERTIVAGTTDATGKVTAPGISNIRFPISLKSYQLLEKANAIRVEAAINTGAGGQPTNIYSDSYVEYSVVSDITVVYDKEK